MCCFSGLVGSDLAPEPTAGEVGCMVSWLAQRCGVGGCVMLRWGGRCTCQRTGRCHFLRHLLPRGGVGGVGVWVVIEIPPPLPGREVVCSLSTGCARSRTRSLHPWLQAGAPSGRWALFRQLLRRGGVGGLGCGWVTIDSFAPLGRGGKERELSTGCACSKTRSLHPWLQAGAPLGHGEGAYGGGAVAWVRCG